MIPNHPLCYHVMILLFKYRGFVGLTFKLVLMEVVNISRLFIRRVDVAVKCSSARDYDVIVESATSIGRDVTIAVLSVTNSEDGGADANLTTWEPCRWFV